MKITSKLALRYLRKNKRKSIAIVLGITVVTILIVSIILLLSTYQEYMINIQRERKNWEIEFKNIKYSDVLEIEKDKNVKETSITKELGLGLENFGDETIKTKVFVKAFDENALTNLGIIINEGRLPKTYKEVIRSYNINLGNIEIGESFDITLNDIKKEYTLVGTASGISELTGVKNGYLQGAIITYLDKDELKEDDIVDVTIITNDIKDVYETGERLSKYLYKTDEEKANNMSYNEELLSYVGITNQDTSFRNTLLIISIFLIVIVTISAVVMIYTSFKLTYSERIKELGVLSSLGMNTKQRKKLITTESNILAIIGIILGIVLGIFLSYFMTKLLNIFIDKVIYDDIIKITNEIFPIISGVELHLVLPFNIIILSAIIVYVIVRISAAMSIKRLSKMTEVEAIKGSANRSKAKELRVPKIVSKIFKEEGELAYKNLKRDGTKYKAVIASITISIVLFLSVSGFIHNLNFGMDSSKEDYIITADYGSGERVSNYILDKGYIEDYYYYTVIPRYIELREENITNELKKMKENDLNVLSVQGKINMPILVYAINEDTYKEVLENLDLSILGENECILINSITNTEKTKYGKNIPITNYKENDKLVLYTNEIGNNDNLDNEEIKNIVENLDNIITSNVNETKDDNTKNFYEFNIVKVVDNISPYIKLDNSNFLAILVNQETLNKIMKKEEKEIIDTEIYVNTSNTETFDEKEEKIKENLGEDIFITNIYEGRISSESEEKIKEIILYSFVGLIAILCIINVFNIIHSSIVLRKREFAVLKSIGMSKKQLNRMLFLEGIFYEIVSIILGIIISTAILYIMYLLMIETSLYNFNISWINIIYCTIATFIMIFITIVHSKNKVINKNAIDEIREENI